MPLQATSRALSSALAIGLQVAARLIMLRQCAQDGQPTNRQPREIRHMNAPPVTLIWILTIGSLIPHSAVEAEIYRWTDADGNSHFSDQAPARADVETLRLPPMNTYSVPEILAAPGDLPEAGNRPRVVMYSASWCGLCKRARRYFRENGIRFTEYDVEKSPKGGRDFASLGGRGVPVILVGKHRMNGFSEAAFESLYLN
jgi:glutaredoxin